jgi:28 kDa A-kinase anchor
MFLTIWSKPTANIPIPEYTANVYFIFQTFPANNTPHKQMLSYTLESNTFVHTLEDGIGFSEEWLDRIIEGKQLAQEVHI